MRKNLKNTGPPHKNGGLIIYATVKGIIYMCVNFSLFGKKMTNCIRFGIIGQDYDLSLSGVIYEIQKL